MSDNHEEHGHSDHHGHEEHGHSDHHGHEEHGHSDHHGHEEHGHSDHHGHEEHGHSDHHGHEDITHLGTLVNRIRGVLAETAIFLTPAANIEGIDPSVQQRDYVGFIQLKIKERLGVKLTFEERKMLRLSDGQNFICGTQVFPDLREIIDVDVRDLVQAVNEKPYLVSQEACSGHFKGTKKPWLDDYGRMAFHVDPTDPRALTLVDSLKNFCEEENSTNENCLFKVEVGSIRGSDDPLYTITWRFNHPVYVEADQLHKAQDWRGFMALQPQMEEATGEAIEVGILDQYNAFIRRAAAFVRSQS